MPPMSLAAALAEVPLLAGLPPSLRERLAAEAREVAIAAGEWLFREGDAARSAYVVRSGRLEVVAEKPVPVVIRTIKRGAVLGEIALLQSGVRTASVAARRDSTLIEIGREQFELLIREVPDFALALMRSLGAQLAANQAPATEPPLRTIAVIALDPAAPCEEVAGRLAHVLARYGTITRLGHDPDRPPADFPALLDRAERDNRRVLLDGGRAARGEPWTDFCRDEADIVVAVTSGVPDPTWIERPAALRGCELVVASRGIADEVLDAVRPARDAGAARRDPTCAGRRTSRRAAWPGGPSGSCCRAAARGRLLTSACWTRSRRREWSSIAWRASAWGPSSAGCSRPTATSARSTRSFTTGSSRTTRATTTRCRRTR